MTLEAKKIDIVQWILRLNDERIIDQIAETVHSIQDASPTLKPQSFTTYFAITDKKFDLEQIKIEQNYRPFEKNELDLLIKEADIQESIEELLESID